jgi:hypothetical protein
MCGRAGREDEKPLLLVWYHVTQLYNQPLSTSHQIPHWVLLVHTEGGVNTEEIDDIDFVHLHIFAVGLDRDGVLHHHVLRQTQPVICPPSSDCRGSLTGTEKEEEVVEVG